MSGNQPTPVPPGLADDDIAAVSELFEADAHVAERFALFLREQEIERLALRLVRDAR